MSDDELIRCFESDRFQESLFIMPITCAWRLLTCASIRFSGSGEVCLRVEAIRCRPRQDQLYNETITCAYLFLIRERMAGCESADWEEFARRNPDLLVWRDGILSRYYREGTLQSDLAREFSCSR